MKKVYSILTFRYPIPSRLSCGVLVAWFTSPISFDHHCKYIKLSVRFSAVVRGIQLYVMMWYSDFWQMVITSTDKLTTLTKANVTNQTSFLRGNCRDHHNTELKNHKVIKLNDINNMNSATNRGWTRITREARKFLLH